MNEQCAISCPMYQGVGGQIVQAEQLREFFQGRISSLQQMQDIDMSGAAAQLDHLDEWAERMPEELQECFEGLKRSVGGNYAFGEGLIEERRVCYQDIATELDERITRLTDARSRMGDNCPGWKKGRIILARLIMDNRIVRRPSICRGEIEGELEER